MRKMKTLLVLKDKDIGEKAKRDKLDKRETARAVAFWKGKIAFINVSNNGYHKLPGGGIEHGEDMHAALHREMLEETGCEIKIGNEIGKILEHRTNIGVIQTSYCFMADVTKIGKANLDEGEKKAGYKLEWVTIEKALTLLQEEKPRAEEWVENYMGKFIVKRDIRFIKVAKALLEK